MYCLGNEKESELSLTNITDEAQNKYAEVLALLDKYLKVLFIREPYLTEETREKTRPQNSTPTS